LRKYSNLNSPKVGIKNREGAKDEKSFGKKKSLLKKDRKNSPEKSENTPKTLLGGHCKADP